MSSEPGRGNVNKEMIFIAAALYDAVGELLNGASGHSVLGLVDLLGPDNVYLSIYENDADPAAIAALASFKSKVKFKSASLPVGLFGIARRADFQKATPPSFLSILLSKIFHASPCQLARSERNPSHS
jgi:hypothetical protein